MFQLSVISDLIRIPPHLFSLPTVDSVKEQLNQKYANKVIHKLGLVISIWDIISIEDGLLKPGDGAIFIQVKFRLAVFKPFVGEILTGYIEKCSEEGLKINMEFFNDIFIPAKFMFQGSKYSPDENCWIWQMDEDTKLYLDLNEKINFRIEEEMFYDVKPKGPINTDGSVQEIKKEQNQEGDESGEKKDKRPPYVLIASCQTDGMGCVSWWD